MEKKITLLGEEITIAFNLAVEMAWERITKQGFTLENMNFKTNLVPLYYAAIIANNEKTNISFDDLMRKASRKEISALDAALSECMKDFLDVPDIIKEEPKPEGEEEEQPKN